jgi:hypothetical protein
MSHEIDVSAHEQVREIFAAFDARDVAALVALMTDDVRLRLGNAEMVEGKAAFAKAVQGFYDSVAGFRHDIVNVWRDPSLLQRVSPPGWLSRGLPGLHRHNSRVRMSGGGLAVAPPTMAAGDSRIVAVWLVARVGSARPSSRVLPGN